MLDQAQRDNFFDRLNAYCNKTMLKLTNDQLNQLLDYLSLFIKWNKTYNLSAIRQPEDMFVKHLLDSLSIAGLIKGERFIDVGTGGGLPGIVLAICYPNKSFTLLDSAGKKTRFLFQVKQQLKLTNVEIQNLRVEKFTPEELFDGVISRAFSSINDMLSLCCHLIKPHGVFFAMKGVVPYEEIDKLAPDYHLDKVHTLDVPNLDANRCLLELSLAQ